MHPQKKVIGLLIHFKVFVANQVFIINLQNNHHIIEIAITDINGPGLLYALRLKPYAS